MKIHLLDCKRVLLDEIANPAMHQRDIAMTYRLAMDSPHSAGIWGEVNRAIMARWSEAGLLRIKRMAHSGSCFREVTT